MVFAKKSKSAMITIELAVSLALIVVVLFVTLGLFGDNLKDMFTKSNFKNIYENEDQRIAFSFFNKDYSGSQINVAITGEQGLEKMRMIANNKGLEIIEKSNDIPLNLTSTEGDTLIFLKWIILTIVGNGDICSYMKIESAEECNAIRDTYSKYNMVVNGNVLTVKAVATSAEVARAEGVSDGSSIFISTGTTSTTNSSPWLKIKKFKEFYKDKTIPIPELMREINYFCNTLTGQNSSTGNLRSELVTLLENFRDKMSDAHDNCICPSPGDAHGCSNLASDIIPDWLGGTNYCTDGNRISFAERNTSSDKINVWIDRINSSSASTMTNSDILKVVTSSSDYEYVVNIARKDHVENPKSYDFLINGIDGLKQKYRITASYNH